ncbi:MAG: RNA polymerase sigma factor [Oligosphaeraceae bacterium]
MLTDKQMRECLTITCPPEIPTPVWNHAVFVARNMVGTSSIVPADLCDIVQEFCIAVIRALPRIKPDGRDPQGTSYLSCIIDRQSMRIYRQRIRSQVDKPCVRLADYVSRSERDDREACVVLGREEQQFWRREEIGVLVRSMPEELRAVCELLMDGLNTEDIARRLHVSPTTIRTRRMPRIRRILEDAGHGR